MHKPVLLREVIEILDPRPGQKYIDATINGGGHSVAILERIGSSGELLGIDIDCELLKAAKFQIPNSKFPNVKLACGNYRDIKKIAEENNFEKIDGILFDLGFSSYHIEKSGRGFSFRRDEPLDMRYDPKGNPVTAERIINEWREEDLERIFREYGEERFAKRIAVGIAQARADQRIRSSRELAGIVWRSVPRQYRKQKIHPATRTFQALRIVVNGETENLKKALESVSSLLASSGKVAVISFHSLEDRIIKQFFKNREGEGIFSVITKKPVVASLKEKKENPRARSAKLRVAQKL